MMGASITRRPRVAAAKQAQIQTGACASYASMTYAGLKSMIFAGVDSEDSRVKAAVKWLSQHYDLKSNPGMGDAGLFYYYHTFAKALTGAGQRYVCRRPGCHTPVSKKHRLNHELLSRQLPNGSWVNDNQHWLESNPDLVTGYALLALAYARP